MECSEKDKLLEGNNTKVSTNRPTCCHGIILPAMFCIIFGGQLCLFVQNEWTQDTNKRVYFQNTTVNISECNDQNKSDPIYQEYEKVQQVSAKWLTFYCLAELVPTTVLQLILPSYTDSYGRKFLLILSTLGQFLKATGITLTVYFEASFLFLVASNLSNGLLGSVFATFSATFSLVADFTVSEDWRTFGIVIIEAIILFGNISASFLSGFFIETIKLGYLYTSVIGASITGLGLFLMIIIPESLPKNQRIKPKPVLGTIKRMTDFYISKEFKGQRTLYILLLLSFSFAILTAVNRNNMETLYLLGKPFCWDPSKIGIFIMVRTAAQGVIGLGSLKLLQYIMSNPVIGIMSTLSNTVSYTIEVFSRTTLMIYMVPVSAMLSFLVIPIIRSLMSSMTSPDKQGAVFAGLSLIEVLSDILATLTQNEIYSFTLSFMDGFVFLILAVLSLINMVLMIAYKCTKPAKTICEITVQSETNKD